MSNISNCIGEQLALLGVSVLAGIMIALFYDVFRGWRRMRRMCSKSRKRQGDVSRTREAWVHLEDVLFWTGYVVITYMVFYQYHYGTPAGYGFLGEGVGIILYYRLLHNWGRCLFACMFWEIYTIFSYLFVRILFPFRIICGKLRKILKNLMKSAKIVFINN